MPLIVKPHRVDNLAAPDAAESIDYNFDMVYRTLSEMIAGEGVLPVVKGGTGMGSYLIGDLLTADSNVSLTTIHAVATGNVVLSQGANTRPAYGKVGLTTHVTGILPIANGGTNADNKTAAFDNLSPLTTKGDLLTHDGTNNVRKAVGSGRQFLTADPAQPDGLLWRTLNISALDDYFLYDTASDIGGYKTTDRDHSTGVQVDLTFAGLADGETLLEEWATPTGEPTSDFMPDGTAHLHIHATKTAGTKTVVVFFRLYRRTAVGVEDLIATSEESGVLTGIEQEIDIEAPVNGFDLDTTDRIVVKVYATVTGVGSAPTVVIEIEGDSYSRFEFPAVAGTGAASGAVTHALLDTDTHTDTETASPTRGAVIVGTGLPIGGGAFWLDGQSFADLDNGYDAAAQQFWSDGGADGAIGFTDTSVIKWRRLPVGPRRSVLGSDGLDAAWVDATVEQPRVRAFLTSNQSISDGAAGGMDYFGTGIQFNTTEYDSDGFWTGASPTRLTVPTGLDGIYLVVGQISWGPSASGRKAGWLFKNGTRFAIAEVNGDDGGLGLSFSVVGFVSLTAGEYVELGVRQDSGGALNALGDALGSYTQLAMVRVAR